MKYGSYVTTREFNGFNIPVPFQNVILRDYCRGLAVPYPLPEVEHKFKNCYMSLITLIEKIDHGGVIIMCSLEMLPANNKYKYLANLFLDKSLSVYGILERKTLSNRIDFLDYIKLRRFSDEINSHRITNDVLQR
jgi:sporadic carbohydrate cluster protein (TIGR04323 family)